MNRNPHLHSSKQSDSRCGVVILIVMVCLLIMSMIAATMLKTALSARRQARRQALSLQSAWLAETAVERAAARLAADGNYSGEVWQVPGSDLSGKPARVEIVVGQAAGEVNRRTVAVTVDYPDKAVWRARSRKRVLVDLDSF